MNLPASTWALGFAALTVAATTAGGALALKSRDRFHLVLGLSAGLLLGLVGFDLLPEVFTLSATSFGGVRAVSVAIIGGFLALHILEGIFGSHEPVDSDYGHEHDHGHIAGTLGAIAMGGHVFSMAWPWGFHFE
jgi:ZIP family zinc transporter